MRLKPTKGDLAECSFETLGGGGGGGGALFTSSIGNRHTLMILAISSRLWGVRLKKLFFFVASFYD